MTQYRLSPAGEQRIEEELAPLLDVRTTLEAVIKQLERLEKERADYLKSNYFIGAIDEAMYALRGLVGDLPSAESVSDELTDSLMEDAPNEYTERVFSDEVQ